jgi:hypothetical protein
MRRTISGKQNLYDIIGFSTPQPGNEFANFKYDGMTLAIQNQGNTTLEVGTLFENEIGFDFLPASIINIAVSNSKQFFIEGNGEIGILFVV